MLGILAKEDAVGFAAGFPKVVSPKIRFVNLGAEDQAAKARSQIGLREQSPGPGSFTFAGLSGNQNSGLRVG